MEKKKNTEAEAELKKIIKRFMPYSNDRRKASNKNKTTLKKCQKLMTLAHKNQETYTHE